MQHPIDDVTTFEGKKGHYTVNETEDDKVADEKRGDSRKRCKVIFLIVLFLLLIAVAAVLAITLGRSQSSVSDKRQDQPVTEAGITLLRNVSSTTKLEVTTGNWATGRPTLVGINVTFPTYASATRQTTEFVTTSRQENTNTTTEARQETTSASTTETVTTDRSTSSDGSFPSPTSPKTKARQETSSATTTETVTADRSTASTSIFPKTSSLVTKLTTRKLQEPTSTTTVETVTTAGQISSTQMHEMTTNSPTTTTSTTTTTTTTDRTTTSKVTSPSTVLRTGSGCESVLLENAITRNTTGGIFQIQVPGFGLVQAYCDATTNGGSWIVFQRRQDGSVNFYRSWNNYATGFGSPNGEFWLGLEAVHQMTKDGACELRIDMIERDGPNYYAEYSSFEIGPRSDNYRLHVKGYSGNATDSLTNPRKSWNNLDNQPFTTSNQDNDQYPRNCASEWKGAWWYNRCMESNLNGKYDEDTDFHYVLWWNHDKARWMNLRFVEMKFRRKR